MYKKDRGSEQITGYDIHTVNNGFIIGELPDNRHSYLNPRTWVAKTREEVALIIEQNMKDDIEKLKKGEKNDVSSIED